MDKIIQKKVINTQLLFGILDKLHASIKKNLQHINLSKIESELLGINKSKISEKELIDIVEKKFPIYDEIQFLSEIIKKREFLNNIEKKIDEEEMKISDINAKIAEQELLLELENEEKKAKKKQKKKAKKAKKAKKGEKGEKGENTEEDEEAIRRIKEDEEAIRRIKEDEEAIRRIKEKEEKEEEEEEEKKRRIKKKEEEEVKSINNSMIESRLKYIFDKKIVPIKKIYDETNNTCNKVMKDINSIQDDILEKKMDIKRYSDNIKSSLNNEIKIKDIDFNTYNNIIEKISNLNMDIKNKNNILLDIKNDLANYYFYFDPFKEENKRNKIEDCKTQKNRCARLQLAIDVNEPDLYKKIKIHGIFPDEKQGISNKKYENPFLLSEEYDIKSFDRILNENFIPFFSSYDLFEKSLNKHVPYSNQTELYFENNIIWLAEAIIVLLTKHRNGKILLESDIYVMENMLNKFFKNEHNLIWGFQKSIINPINQNILYIYFKICFNTTSNLWQFCDNNYDIIDDEEVYLTNLDTGLGHKKQKSKRKRSLRQKSKRKRSLRQKSKRKSIRQKTKRKSAR